MLSALKEFVLYALMCNAGTFWESPFFSRGRLGRACSAREEKKSKAPPAEKAPPSTSPPAPAAAAPAADANRPAAAEYQRLLEEWKTVLKDMRKLKLQYQSGGFADQAASPKGLDHAGRKGERDGRETEAAGLKAYAEVAKRRSAAHAVFGQAVGRCDSA